MISNLKRNEIYNLKNFALITFFCFFSTVAVSKTTCFSSVDRILRAKKGWRFSREAENSLRAIFDQTNISSEQKVTTLFWALLNKRTKHFSPKIQRKTQRMIKQFYFDSPRNDIPIDEIIRNSDKEFALTWEEYDPFYLPETNWINPAPIKYMSQTESAIIYLHEFQHAFDFNNYPYLYRYFTQAVEFVENFSLFKFISPLLLHQLEGRAIAAQWEIARRIPLHIRKELISNLKNIEKQSLNSWTIKLVKRHAEANNLTTEEFLLINPNFVKKIREATKKSFLFRKKHMFRKVSIATLSNAHLQRDSFIKELRKVHGYTIWHSLMDANRIKGLRKIFLMTIGLQVAFHTVMQDTENIKIIALDYFTFHAIISHLLEKYDGENE